MKKASAPTKSWDTIATRNIWEAISRESEADLRRALAKGGNPNDVKSLNDWTASDSPLTSAVARGFLPGVKLLLDAGAKRYINGCGSPLGLALTHRNEEVFPFVLDCLAPPTQHEIVTCFTHLLRTPATGKESRLVRLIQSMASTNTRLGGEAGLVVAMQALGENGPSYTVRPEVIDRLLQARLLRPNALASAAHAQGLDEWAVGLGMRRWNTPEATHALALLHALQFPFQAAAETCDEGPSRDWLLGQSAIVQANQMETQTPKARTPGRASRL